MASPLMPERPRASIFATFLLLSLLVHLLVLLWLNRAKLSLGEVEPPPIVVKLAPPAPAPADRTASAARPAARPPGPEAKPAPARIENQIVAPSDQENEQPPLGRAYLSDRDNRVEKESVKRGNPEAGTSDAPAEPPKEQVASIPRPAPAPQPAQAAPKTAPKPPPSAAKAAPKAAPRAAPPAAAAARPAPPEDSGPPGDTRTGKPLPGLDQLLAPPSEVLARADTARDDDRPAAGDRAGALDPRRDLVSAPPPARGIFSGARGTFDDLDVAAGNLTLLNTKADRFAPFVRRVGTRVFQNLLIYQRRDLALNDILAAHEPITVRAILDQNGRLKDVQVEERSGSLAVDQTLLNALRQAAFDQNPPRSAANANGEFEFVFQAQLAASVGPGGGEAQIRAIESRLRVGLL